MDCYGAPHRWGGKGAKSFPLPKTCHTYPVKMKLGTVIPYLKKSGDAHFEFC